MVGHPEISLNASEAFCVDVDFDSNALALIAWQLHEGAYQLSGGFDASFDSLDNLHTVFEGSKKIAAINSGYRRDIGISQIMDELIDSLSPLSIRKANKVFLSLCASTNEQLSTLFRALTQFEAITGRFEYDYVLQLMPSYAIGQSRGVLVLGY